MKNLNELSEAEIIGQCIGAAIKLVTHGMVIITCGRYLAWW